MTRKKNFSLSTTQIILLSLLITILLGSVLLALPISSADGVAVSYLDALFTATTSTCVTGLVTLPTFSSWSLFGQIVILVLIQAENLKKAHIKMLQVSMVLGLNVYAFLLKVFVFQAIVMEEKHVLHSSKDI